MNAIQITTGELAQCAISVRDLERSKSFYRDLLGLPFLFEAANVVFFDLGGVRFMLGEAGTRSINPGDTLLYFASADLDLAHQRLTAADVPCDASPHRVAPLGMIELWMAFYRDPDGYRFGLIEERARG